MLSSLSNPVVYQPVYQGRFVLLDGTNLIRLEGRDKPSFTNFLTALVEVAPRTLDFIVFFDACTPYVLREHNCNEEVACRMLSLRFPDHFIVTNGGTKADRLILPQIRRRDGVVVTRDLYRDEPYAQRFPQVIAPERLVAVHKVREDLQIGDELCPLQSDLPALMTVLRSIMQKKVKPLPSAA